jgi:hypothetical protein
MWNELAVAVERQHGEPVIVCEGTLAAVVAALQPVKPGRLSGIRVSLPDRRAAPFSFEGASLRTLLNNPARPGAYPSLLLPAAVPMDMPLALPA